MISVSESWDLSRCLLLTESGQCSVHSARPASCRRVLCLISFLRDLRASLWHGVTISVHFLNVRNLSLLARKFSITLWMGQRLRVILRLAWNLKEVNSSESDSRQENPSSAKVSRTPGFGAQDYRLADISLADSIRTETVLWREVPESGTSVPTVPPPQQFPLLVIHKVNFVQGQQDLLKTNCWWRTSGGIKVLLHGRCQLTWLEGWKVESNQLEGMIEMCCVLKVIRWLDRFSIIII